MAASANIVVNINATQTSPLDLGTGTFPSISNNTFSFTDGTGAAQIQTVFSDERSLNASSNEELDLAGVLADAFGNTITFAAIKGIIVKAAATNGDTISVGGSAANGFDSWVGATGDLVKVNPGGIFVLLDPGATGYAVTASTGDLLKITNDNSGAAGVYQITLIGE